MPLSNITLKTHAWQGRLKSLIVGEESYLLEVSRYIELNPVRAKIVKDPRDHPLSSHSFYTYGKRNPLIDEHPFYESLGKAPKEHKRRYREFVRTPFAIEMGLIEEVIIE